MREKEETRRLRDRAEGEREKQELRKERDERIISIMQHPYLLGRYSNINCLSWVSTR